MFFARTLRWPRRWSWNQRQQRDTPASASPCWNRARPSR